MRCLVHILSRSQIVQDLRESLSSMSSLFNLQLPLSVSCPNCSLTVKEADACHVLIACAGFYSHCFRTLLQAGLPDRTTTSCDHWVHESAHHKTLIHTQHRPLSTYYSLWTFGLKSWHCQLSCPFSIVGWDPLKCLDHFQLLRFLDSVIDSLVNTSRRTPRFIWAWHQDITFSTDEYLKKKIVIYMDVDDAKPCRQTGMTRRGEVPRMQLIRSSLLSI